jgi:hypothetical protein
MRVISCFLALFKEKLLPLTEGYQPESQISSFQTNAIQTIPPYSGSNVPIPVSLVHETTPEK